MHFYQIVAFVQSQNVSMVSQLNHSNNLPGNAKGNIRTGHFYLHCPVCALLASLPYRARSALHIQENEVRGSEGGAELLNAMPLHVRSCVYIPLPVLWQW